MPRFTVLVLFVLFTCCQSGKKDIIRPDHEVIVATIDQDTLTLADFKDFADKESYRQSDLSKSADRHRILNELIQDRLILKSAESDETAGNDSIAFILKNAEDEKYAGRLIRLKFIYPNVPEGELKAFYEKMKYEMNVRHLFVFHNENRQIKIRSEGVPYRNRAQAKRIADSLHKEAMKNPDGFAGMTEIHSDDEDTRFRKGEIGYIHYDKYDPVFRDALFELKENRISDILESREGFHIFQKIGMRLSETIEPFEKIRPAILSAFADQYETRPTRQMSEEYDRFSDSLLKASRMDYDEKGIGLFLDRYRRILSPSDLKSAFTSDEMKVPLARYENGEIPLMEIVQVMSGNRTKIKLDAPIMRQGLKKVAVTRVLALEARKQAVALLPRQRDELRKLKQTLIKDLHTYRNVDALIRIGEKDVLEFYMNNQRVYREPDKVGFNELFSPDQGLIGQYYQEIRKTGDFAGVAKKAESVKGNRSGQSGLIPVSKNNELTLHAWKMDPGDVSEPFTWSGGGYSIIQLTEKIQGQQIPFEDIKDKVRNDLFNFHRNNYRNLWISKLKDKHKVTLFEKNLADYYEVIIR